SRASAPWSYPCAETPDHPYPACFLLLLMRDPFGRMTAIGGMSDSQPVTQCIPPRSDHRIGNAEHAPAGERVPGHLGEHIEAAAIAVNGLGQDAPEGMRSGDAMPGIAMREIYAIADPPHLWNAAEGQRESSTPGVIDPDIFQSRKDLQHIRPQLRLDIARIRAATDRPAPEKQALVAREAVIIKDITDILDTGILRAQRMGAITAKRLGRHDRRRNRHDPRCQRRHDTAKIG